MNSKRQTIWLVSMLSLMVVLSAYYLFTEDASKLDTASVTPETEQIVVDNVVTTPESVGKVGKTEDKTTQAKITDEAVLEKVAQQGKSSEDYFIGQQLQRNANLAEQADSLMTIITDSKQNTEAVSKAYDDLAVINSRTAKISNIEDELMKDYPQVIVTEAANKWKVVLQDNKLERSQAVSIIDLVTSELNIAAANVSIQIMPLKNQ